MIETPPLTGIIAPPFTPFKSNGELNLAAVEKQAEYFAETGVKAVFVAGTTGEGFSLSDPERRQLAERWVQVGKSTGITVILQIGCSSLTASRERAAHAEHIGADGISFVAPYYYQVDTVDALVDYCAAVACQAPTTPFYYYHIPGFTGCSVSPSSFLETAATRVPTLRGLKFTDRDLGELQQCIALLDGRFDVLFGWDEALLAGVSLGVRGAIGSTYNFAAPLYTQILDAFESGNQASARLCQLKSVAIVNVLDGFGSYMSAAKAAMAMVGVDCGPPRPPLPTLGEIELKRLRVELEQVGLFELLQQVA